MATPAPSSITSNLQKFGSNFDHTNLHKLGPQSELEKLVKIVPSEKVSECFDSMGMPTKFPSLGEREYLVMCKANHCPVHPNEIIIFGVCTFETITQIAQESLRTQQPVEWRLMIISQETETEVMKGSALYQAAPPTRRYAIK